MSSEICTECHHGYDDEIGVVNKETHCHYICQKCTECGQDSNPEHKRGRVNWYTGCHYMCLRCKICNQSGHVDPIAGWHFICAYNALAQQTN
jgi:hypothetical protein